MTEKTKGHGYFRKKKCLKHKKQKYLDQFVR